MQIDINYLLSKTVELKGSDLHIIPDYPINIRIDGSLQSIGDISTAADINLIIDKLLSDDKKKILEKEKDIDFAYQLQNGARFRANICKQNDTYSASFRYIPNNILSVDDLNLPASVKELIKLKQGFILVVGPTGSGKSTTLASVINSINLTKTSHILTIEDPVEYVYPKALSIITQRELSRDTDHWSDAIKSALRQDINVLLIGEMRDYLSISAALNVAETGHLVFSTLHTNSAAETVSRIISLFPSDQQSQIRHMLAQTLSAVISQRLIPVAGGGREAIYEVMLCNNAISNLIREGKEYQIDNVIRTSSDYGMQSLEYNLVDFIRQGKVTLEQAQSLTSNPAEILRLLR